MGNPQQIAALARQLREEIISRNNGQKQSPTSGVPDSFPTYLIIPISLGVVGIMVAGFFLIRRRKIRLKRKFKVQK